MPHAIALDHEYAKKGLRVVLVHTQQFGDLAGFVYKQFPSNRAMVTADNPVQIGNEDESTLRLPRAALVGVDGRVLAFGPRAEVGAEIDRLIPIELSRMKRGWGEHPAAVKARALLYGKDDLIGARNVLAAVELDPANEAEMSEVRRELDLRYRSLITQLEHATKSGRWLDARDLGRTLERGIGDDAGWAIETADLLASLETPEAKQGLRLDAKIERVLKDIAKKGVEERHPAQLRKIVAGEQNTAIWARATRLAGVLSRVVAQS